jgi:aspartyl-tRNA(Asn)/glutamyl-tRNA(Gln) amidotransferase subunit A
MSWDSIAELAEKVQAGELSATELVEKSLGIIEQHGEYKAIIATVKDRALDRARRIDENIRNGKQVGKLAGVPFIAKDNFLTFGSETTAASNILKTFDAPYQATAIEKLENEGAICVAKANMDAFGHGASTENSDFFTTLNPHDKTRVPGGSSGGSAVGVALKMAPFALGTDTGGSSRQPASFSGCIGYKPTYGLISRSGVIAMASSTDTIGVLTNTVEDLSVVVDVLAGQDPLDSTTVKRQDSYLLGSSSTKSKIGIIKEYFSQGVQPDVAHQVMSAAEDLKKAGHEVVEISLPSLPLALAVYYIVVPAEISSNLARYDGQRFGHHVTNANNLDESYEQAREEGFGKEAKRRIMIGTYVLSSGYYDAYYKKAQTVRTKLIKEFEEAFKQVDFLLGPTAPTTAFKIGENASDPLQMYLADVMTVGPSVVGVPALSIPCGEVDGMPVGLQLIAPQGKDKELLELAHAYEEARS